MQPILAADETPSRVAGGSNNTSRALGVNVDGGTVTFYGYSPATAVNPFGSTVTNLPGGISWPWPGTVGNYEGMQFNGGQNVRISAFLNTSVLPSFRLAGTSTQFVAAKFLIGPVYTDGTPNALTTLKISFVLSGDTLTYTRPDDYTANGVVTQFAADYLLGVSLGWLTGV